MRYAIARDTIEKFGGYALSHLQINNLKTHHLGPINLTVSDGSAISIRGNSGAGKSLLLRAIADLDPHQGEVLLDDVSSNDYRGSQWRQRVGYLPAMSQWWGDGVREHFIHAIDQSLLASWLNTLELDEAILDAPISTLSSGERQRVALLRLLANQPQALLLDEPTASLDHDNTLRVEKLVADYQAQHRCIVIWVSHDPEQLARVASRHFIIKQGQLVPLPASQTQALLGAPA